MERKQRRSGAAGEVSLASGFMADLIDPKIAARKAQQKAITRGLRKFFDSVAAEPVPEEFLELLRKLDKTDAGT